MKLCVVIVNYNVKYFIEQTLRSVFESRVNFDFEVYVVDNASHDGSQDMIKAKFPKVNLIESEENLGFSKGNNLALRKTSAEYRLLLNPDTILAEDTLQTCVDYMDNHDDVGGLGVRMIDGGGQFLPESKRGLPTPFVAFCKAFGLSRLFPKSPTFNRYHLGHIDEFETSEVDVLSGAFMLMRGKVLDKIGLLDEDFFMYGEDIDLSYRIQKAGYKNVYLPSTTIVHFKGESTKRGSLNYVRVFYKAMIIFARKHFVGSGAVWLLILYRIAVLLRAVFSLVSRAFSFILPVLLDALVIMVGLRLMTILWANIYFQDPDYYSSVPLLWHHSSYTVFWLVTLFLAGAYDKYYSLSKLWKSLTWGTLFLLIVFSLMPSAWRPSRAVLLLGSVWTLAMLSLIRYILGHVKGKYEKGKRLAIIGSPGEIGRAEQLMKDNRFIYDKAFYITPTGEMNHHYVGTLEDLGDVVDSYLIDDVIFCSKDVDHSEVIRWMTRFSDSKTVRIIPEESMGMIASRFKNKQGELYAIDANMNLGQQEKRRQKRVLDLLLVPIVLIFSPFLYLLRGGTNWFGAALGVLFGKYTWVGMNGIAGLDLYLPELREGIVDVAEGAPEDMEVRKRIYTLYARDYNIWLDLDGLRRYLMDGNG
jgi:GT2 family glycosyltransferase